MMGATAELLLVQLPPGVGSVSVVVRPLQMLVVPAIAAGLGYTVIGVVIRQPVGNVYVMVVAPSATPVTTPVVEFTEAMAPLADDHVPPGEASERVLVAPRHTLETPKMGSGVGFTVNTDVV
jgi:hypothetical protein